MFDYRTAAATMEEKLRQAQKRDEGARYESDLGVRRRRLTVAVAATLALVLVFANGPSETSTADIANNPEVDVISEIVGPAENTWTDLHTGVRKTLPLLRARLTPPSGSVVLRPRRPRCKSRRLAAHVVQSAGAFEGGDSARGTGARRTQATDRPRHADRPSRPTGEC